MALLQLLQAEMQRLAYGISSATTKDQHLRLLARYPFLVLSIDDTAASPAVRLANNNAMSSHAEDESVYSGDETLPDSDLSSDEADCTITKSDYVKTVTSFADDATILNS